MPCDYDSGDDSGDSSDDCEYGGSECLGQPCDTNKKSSSPKRSSVSYNCVDGVWVEEWTWSSEPSETGSGPVLFEPCDNEGEIIPISQHYTANFESSGSDDSDSRIKIIKGMDLRTE